MSAVGTGVEDAYNTQRSDHDPSLDPWDLKSTLQRKANTSAHFDKLQERRLQLQRRAENKLQ
jgi:hypothetical protein